MIEIRNRKTNRFLYRAYADSLEGVDLRGAHLFRADLAGASLRGADLSGADLREATVAGADLTGAALRHVMLYQSDLTGARLERTDLRGAAFWRTRLDGTDLTTTNLAGARYPRTLRWPEGFDPAAAGALLEAPERTEVCALLLETLGEAPGWVVPGHASLPFDLGMIADAPDDFERLGIRFLSPLSDWLEVGPQHVDLTRQAKLRKEYFPSTECQEAIQNDERRVEACTQTLASGERVLFWSGPRLGSCLAVLWVLDALHQRGADLRNASLLFWPTTPGESPTEPDTRRAFEQLVPVPEVLEPLIDVRRHVASDSDVVQADLSALPPQVRDWAAVTDYLADYLPDERGLDVPDSHLLNLLTEEWQSMSALASRFPHPREPGWGVLYRDRLIELSGHDPATRGSAPDPAPTLVAVRRRRDGDVWRSPFRITPLGSRVRAGEEDALALGLFRRWVGGRLVAKERPLRRPARRGFHLDR
jgi:hypothetical protein